MTGLDHQSSAAIELAASWLAQNKQRLRRERIALVPAVRQQFGLTVNEALVACAESVLHERTGDFVPHGNEVDGVARGR